ncbi:MAG: CoA:oxalate CoA-transferase, partial [Thermoleophilaceae bacterium]|nr:CoA:oxalate CoA-transferase [Thermoleophilaceae bacterium]
MSAPADAPLSGVEVLDLSQGIAGAYCSMILQELGARVVKCEPPGGEWTRRLDPVIGGTSALFAAMNSGKRSIVVDLKTAAGVELVKRAAGHVDLLIDSMRPGVLARLGLGADDLRERNPALVHTSITGFGQTGPWAMRPAVDVIAQALGGMLAVTGPKDGDPVRAPLVADLHCGAMAAIGSLARLYAAREDGGGGRVDANLVESVMGLQRSSLVVAAFTGERPARLGSDAEYAAPNGAFRALDGHVAIAANLPGRWEAFCEVIGAPELLAEERFSDNHGRVV